MAVVEHCQTHTCNCVKCSASSVWDLTLQVWYAERCECSRCRKRMTADGCHSLNAHHGSLNRLVLCSVPVLLCLSFSVADVFQLCVQPPDDASRPVLFWRLEFFYRMSSLVLCVSAMYVVTKTLVASGVLRRFYMSALMCSFCTDEVRSYKCTFSDW